MACVVFQKQLFEGGIENLSDARSTTLRGLLLSTGVVPDTPQWTQVWAVLYGHFLFFYTDGTATGEPFEEPAWFVDLLQCQVRFVELPFAIIFTFKCENTRPLSFAL